MRIRMILIFWVFVGVLIGTLVSRVDQFFLADKVSANDAQTRALLGALTESIKSEISKLKEQVVTAWPQASSELQNKFSMLGSLKKNNSGEWIIDPVYYKSNSEIKNWAQAYSILALQKRDPKQSALLGMELYSLLDPQRKNYFLILTSSQSEILAALVDENVFRSIFDRQKGQIINSFLVNQNGQTVAHPTNEYVGSLMTDDPFVADMMNSEANAGQGLFLNGNDKWQGRYERVLNTNLFVVAATPMSSIIGDRRALQLQIILFGLGFALIGTVIIYIYVQENDSRWAVKSTNTSGLVSQTLKTNKPYEVPVSSHKAYSQTAKGIANELRGPLLSLLGEARLLREKITDEKVSEELKKIENRAQEISGVLQKLKDFSGEADEKFQKIGLDKIIDDVLKQLAPKIKIKNIELIKKYDGDNFLIELPVRKIKIAIEQIISNSIEALERTAQKTIEVHLLRSEDNTAAKESAGLQLIISDTGPGIAESELAQIFEPFYSTKNRIKHVGLGLSLALGIVRSVGGDIVAESNTGKGLVIKMNLPINEKQNLVNIPEISSEFSAANDNSDKSIKPDNLEQVFSEKKSNRPIEVPEMLSDVQVQRTMDMIDHLDELPDSFVPDKNIMIAPSTISNGSDKTDSATLAKNNQVLSSPVLQELPKKTDLPLPPPPLKEDLGGQVTIDRPTQIQKPVSERVGRLFKLSTSVRKPQSGSGAET